MACGCTRSAARDPAVGSSTGRVEAPRLDPDPQRLQIAQAIATSHLSRVGAHLVHPSSDVEHLEAAMMHAPVVILCHDGGTARGEPVFVYANRAAARLWRTTIEDLIGMPSRLSAPPEHRHERARMLAHAAAAGVVVGYSGERVAADGTRFLIQDATLWTVDLPDGTIGQAATFERWRTIGDGPMSGSGPGIR